MDDVLENKPLTHLFKKPVSINVRALLCQEQVHIIEKRTINLPKSSSNISLPKHMRAWTHIIKIYNIIMKPLKQTIEPKCAVPKCSSLPTDEILNRGPSMCPGEFLKVQFFNLRI